MSENTRQNEVVVMIHGQEVLRLDPKGDIVFHRAGTPVTL